MSSTLIQRLAPMLLSAEPATEAVDALKLCLLHFLTCAFEARNLPWSRHARAIAERTAGEASIIGGEHRVGVQDAAFANAVAGHGLVREDMHAGAVSHFGVVVLPAMLALAQRHRVSGAEFAAACIVGYEVGARVGRLLVTPAFMRHWRPTGFTGPLAAAAAGARLLRLPANQAGCALAFAANCTGGLNQWPREGGEEMFFHPGFAARNALLAVDIAGQGAYGSAGALDGEAGLFSALGSGPEPETGVTLFPNGSAEILSVFRKALPVCNFAQTPCQVALKLVRDHGLNAANIERVLVRASEAAVGYPGCDSRGPFERVLQAKMSIPFCVAVALIDGAVAEASFGDLSRPELLRIIAGTTLTPDATFTAAFPAHQGAEVLVQMCDGARYQACMADLEAASVELVRARFDGAAREVLGAARAEELGARVGELEALEDVAVLMRLSEAAH